MDKAIEAVCSTSEQATAVGNLLDDNGTETAGEARRLAISGNVEVKTDNGTFAVDPLGLVFRRDVGRVTG